MLFVYNFLCRCEVSMPDEDTQAVQRAISDIEQISTLKIDLKENVDTMTDYLPKVDFLETNNRISAIRTKRSSEIKTQNFPITSPSDITTVLRPQFAGSGEPAMKANNTILLTT